MVETLIKKHLFEGKVEIQGEIAKGQTGTVLYGYDLELRQEVAIKIYHSHINGRVIQGKSFIEKSQPLLRLDHPNLIKIFKVEEENETPIIFMEFFDAPNLKRIIQDKGPMPVQDMLMRAREITEFLVHIHFQGIIHGTLHPGHVLISPQGQIKVIDLGFPWILMDILSNCDEELLRPLPYLPPEIAKEELLEVSSDLYCLGIMMYEMLTGTVPYAGLPKTSIMGKLAFDQADPEFDFPSHIPEAVCNLIRQMTRNKAKQRLQDTTHVLTIINQQLAKLPLSEEQAFSTPKARQPQAPQPKEQTQPEKASTPSAPPNTQKLTLKHRHPPQHPQASAHDPRGTHNALFRKIGITLSIIMLIGIAGALGYWYRDIFDPPTPTLQRPPDHPSQISKLPQTTSLKNHGSVTPDPKIPQREKPRLKKDASTKNPSPPLPTKKESGPRPQSKLTPISQQSGMKPDKPRSAQRPRSPKTKQIKNVVPIRKQPDITSRPTAGITQPAGSPTADSISIPLPPQASKNMTRQEPTTLSPSKKPVSPETQSAQVSTPSKEIQDELTDKEIEQILQLLDKPAIDISSIPTP